MLSLKSLLPCHAHGRRAFRRASRGPPASATACCGSTSPPTTTTPGHRAGRALARRAREAGIEAHLLVPLFDDWNTDLVRFGPAHTRAALAAQLAPDDALRFAADR